MELTEIVFGEGEGFSWQLTGPDGRAVLDTDRDYLTINWSVTSGATAAADFVNLIAEYAKPDPNTSAVVQWGPEETTDTTYYVLAEEVMQYGEKREYNLLRLDLDDNCSVAWERLPGLGDMLIGYGNAWTELQGLLSYDSLFTVLMTNTNDYLLKEVGPVIEKLAETLGRGDALAGAAKGIARAKGSVW